ncbi:hypothetical protein BKA65DRAFT_413712 [Rhexocercosporidium sp. MPI-PUGE-AT-0058]|nr:hypothetical protein BKA65DRAFT_413712 [Rhexocercosporidium sp. MPI-PUGE-AT-0058]
MALILPKGIVVNSDQINKSIERIATEPLDQAQIAEFWKVYTTTKRRLLDPTAERLENYWWRIWYSDKKYLDGATVARLFDHISNGPTVVPLRGPPNRVEGPTPPNRSIQHGPGAASTTALQQHRPSGPSTSSGTTTTTSSVSRAPAPMPHPILKKTRGPSTGGPRPTARFISPHESEHEGDQNSSVSPNSHVVVQPPSPDPQYEKSDKKTIGTVGRKKTGFSASKKKRPVIVRRQSSQTSQSSADAAAKEAEAAQAASETRSSVDGPPTRTQSRFQENFTPSPDRSASSQMSKRRVSDRKQSPRKLSGGKGRTTSSKGSEEVASSGDPGPSTHLSRIENLPEQEEGEKSTPEQVEELEMQRIMLAEANARLQRNTKGVSERISDPETERKTTSKSPRSKSARTSESPGVDAMRLVQHDPKGAPSLAPTLAAATGKVELGGVDIDPPRLPTKPAPSPKETKGKGRATEESDPVDLFAKRPVQPVKPAPVADSLSRSKSQLTLLLKQDKEKSNRNEKEVKRRK